MKTEDFIFKETIKAVTKAGYDEFQAVEVANHVLLKWRQNEITRAHALIEEGLLYAKQHLKKPVY